MDMSSCHHVLYISAMKKITSFFGIKKKSSKSTNKAKKEESSGSTSPSITTHDVFFENNNTKEQTGGAPQRRSNGQHDAGIPIRSMGELGGIEEEKDEDLTDRCVCSKQSSVIICDLTFCTLNFRKKLQLFNFKKK